MDKEINELIDISRFYGKDSDFVIAGGGNTSYKNKDCLWIKASGIPLDGISEDGFVRMSREKLENIGTREYSSDSGLRESQVKDDLNAAVLPGCSRRPSVETSLHDIINFPFIVHTHPTVINALACSVNPQVLANEIFGNEALFIEYTDPGYVLFKKVSAAIRQFRDEHGREPSFIILENHGAFAAGNTTDSIKEIYSTATQKILSAAGCGIPEDEIRFTEFSGKNAVNAIYGAENSSSVILAQSGLFDEFISDRKAFSEVDTAFTPDHAVYCRSHFLFLETDMEPEMKYEMDIFRARYGYLPKVAALKNRGLMIISENAKSSETVLLLTANMMKIALIARKFSGVKPMTDLQINFIENWEVENYRRKMAAK